MQSRRPSQLALKRLQLGLEQKQVANLLGQKTIHQYNRLENGQRPASFKDAIKLSLIFGRPISVLFNDYFQECRDDLEKQLEKLSLSHLIKLEKSEKCAYLDMMSAEYVSKTNADKIRHHITVLIEERSQKILRH